VQVPVLKQGSYLIATVQPSVSDDDFLHLRKSLLDRVRASRSKGVVIDVTAIDVLDSFACRTLSEIASMILLQGAVTVVVGIQPEVAFSMVQLGSTLDGVVTALDLEEGLAYLDERRHAQQ
jgi:rsbT antagonist protein RsbS